MAADEEGSSNNEVVSVQGMPRSVDVPDAAGQQVLPDGMTVPTVQPGNTPTSGQALDANSQQCKVGKFSDARCKLTSPSGGI